MPQLLIRTAGGAEFIATMHVYAKTAGYRTLAFVTALAVYVSLAQPPVSADPNRKGVERTLEVITAIYYGKDAGDMLKSIGPLAVDTEAGEIYVCDSGNKKLNIYSNSGSFIADFNNFGSLPTCGVPTLAEKGNILVTTGYSPTIAVLNPLGNLVEEIDLSGIPGGGVDPAKIVIDSFGRKIIQDIRNMRVVVLTPDWEFLFQVGKNGTNEGELVAPAGIALDEEGNIYIADAKQRQVSVFTSGGVFLRRFGTPGAADGTLSRPTDVAIDGFGRVYVVDNKRHTLLVYLTDGTYLYEKIGYGTSNGALYYPFSIFIDREKNLLYTSEQQRVQVFKLDEPEAEPEEMADEKASQG